MTLERARSRRPITWLTLVGVLLLPALIGGVLVAALHSPDKRLDSMTAAIVNLDEPITLDGQLVPLGRQLAAGLVEGSDEIDSNLTWIISNAQDAAEGIGDGTYQAVVTIPESFSANATSGSRAVNDTTIPPEQAQLEVQTAPDGRLADGLITNQIAQAAASTLGRTLSETTLDNVLLSFTTLGEKIGEAADGAGELATGSTDAATGAAELPDGVQQIADGASALSTGAGDLAAGLDEISGHATTAADGAQLLGDGLVTGATGLQENGLVPAELSGAASSASTTTMAAAEAFATTMGTLGGYVEECYMLGEAAPFELCGKLAALAEGSVADIETAYTGAFTAQGVSDGLSTFDTEASAEISSQMAAAGTAAQELASGLTQLGEGVDLSADGARALGTGATDLTTGAGTLKEGTVTLSEGLTAIAEGTTDLASGLDEASAQLPSFTEQESQTVASAIADPVTSNAEGFGGFGATAIPLLAAVALWLGGLASFVVLRAVSGQVLTSRRSSAALALRSLAPAAGLGAAQGLLVALVVQFVAEYSLADWWVFAGTAIVTGIAFAAVHQALIAALGGTGRWLAALAAVLAVATGIISTVPGWLISLASALPTAPAVTALIGTEGAASALVGVLVWGALALIVTIVATTARRTTSARALLRIA